MQKSDIKYIFVIFNFMQKYLTLNIKYRVILKLTAESNL